MIKIRPHHLYCFLNYEGKGYTQDFVDHMTKILARIDAGEKIELVTGPDDICAPLCSSEYWHCLKLSVEMRDAVALRHMPWKIGDEFVLTKELREELLRSFKDGGFQEVCHRCERASFCEIK